jgi:hypothetical protein
MTREEMSLLRCYINLLTFPKIVTRPHGVTCHKTSVHNYDQEILRSHDHDLSRYLHEGTEENHKNLSHKNRSAGRKLNREPHKYYAPEVFHA